MVGKLQSDGRYRALLRWLVLCLAVALAVRRWVWMPTLIVGNSMLPTLRNGEFAAVNKLAYVFQAPQRGDIVVIRTGSGLLVKRVVGLPGEEIAVRHGAFYVNGVQLHEPCAHCGHYPDNIAPGRIGPHCFVVAGDNRSGTIIAVVDRDRIVGRYVSLF